MAGLSRRVLTVTSAGRVIDPFIVEAAPTSTLRGRWRRIQSNWTSGKALRLAEKNIPGYKDSQVLEAAENALVVVHDAFARGSKNALRGVATELFESALKRGMALYGSGGHGERPGAEIISFPEGSKIIQGRTYFSKPEGARGFATVRCVTHQAPIGPPARPIAPPAGAEGQWLAAVAPSGALYYYNTATGVRTWKRPAQYGVVGVVPADPLTAGGVRELLPGTDELGRPVMRVVNYVVMEFAVAAGAAGSWKICAL